MKETEGLAGFLLTPAPATLPPLAYFCRAVSQTLREACTDHTLQALNR